MPRHPFAKYPNHVLVETGTYMGDGVQAALEAGFSRVISFEVVPHLHKCSSQRFKGNKAVELICGSSATKLFDTIRDIKEPITFWLDGHYSTGLTGYDPEHICPLLQELEQIKKHGSHHTILIDDRRLLRIDAVAAANDAFGVDEATIRAKLLEINPRYNIKYEDGYVPNDIIAAYI